MAEDIATPTLDDIIDRAAARALAYGDLERSAARQVAALRAMPRHEERLEALSCGAPSSTNPALVELLLDEARGRLHDSPDDAHDLGELAEVAALRLSGGCYGDDFCRDRVTEARACRANALRARGELRQAEDLMIDVVRRTYESCDPFLIAEVASFSASLAKDQRRFEDAIACLEEAERWFVALGASADLLARVSLQRASVVALRGDPAAAVEEVVAVLERHGAEMEPELRFIARHNLVSYLCQAGRYGEARELLAEIAPSYAHHRHRSFRIRFHWREGQIAHGLGEAAAAEREYVQARDAFLAAGMGYSAALVALDLATLYLEAGRTAEVREIAGWTCALFESQEIHREALVALTLFRQAAFEDALSVAHLRRLARYVAALRAGTGAVSEPAS